MPRRATVTIYDGDDFERLAEARQRVAVAEARAIREQPSSRFGAADAEPEYVTEAKAAYDALVDAASERAEAWVLESIGNAEFRDLVKEHPPRKVDGEDGKQVTHEDDQGFEVNTEKFGLALLLFRDAEDPEIRTITEPEFSTVEQLRKRLKRLAQGEIESLWTRAYALNVGGIADPKLARYSTATTSSET